MLAATGFGDKMRLDLQRECSSSERQLTRGYREGYRECGFRRWKLHGDSSGSYPMERFAYSGIKTSGSTKELVSRFVKSYVCFRA